MLARSGMRTVKYMCRFSMPWMVGLLTLVVQVAAFILGRSAALGTPSAPTAHLLGRQRITRVKY